MTRVLVAATSAVVRAGLEAIIRGSSGLEVVGVAAGASDLVEQIERLEPDIVLAELERGAESPAPRLPAFDARAGPPALVLLTDDIDNGGVADLLRMGARAVLPRNAQPDEIEASIRAAATGLIVLNVDGLQSILSYVPASGTAIRATFEPLTPRESEVLGMMAEGAGNKLIARRLGISEHTVKFHVGSILAKLEASSRTEAVTVGVRRGLIMV